MSAPLIVSIPHSLGREEATRRLKAGLTRAASSIPVLKVDDDLSRIQLDSCSASDCFA